MVKQRCRIRCWAGLVFCLLLCRVGWSQSNLPQVSNRPPSENEFGYRPTDESTIQVTPPGFVWLPEPQAESYILQCSQHKNFSSIGYEKTMIPGNVHCSSTVFKPGRWYWRYTFVDEKGNRAGWSVVRSFTIADNASYFPQPSLTQLLERLPQEHPKLFLRPETAASFRESTEKEAPLLWTSFLAHVEEMANDPVETAEPAPYPDGRRGTGKANIDLWRLNRRIVVSAVDHTANLAFAYRLTGDERFGAKARDWIMVIVSWPPDGTTSYQYNDECGMPILSGVSRAYTWAYDALSETERRKIIEVMSIRGEEVYRYLHDQHQHTVSPYESHRNRAWHFMSEAAIAFIDEIPEAKTWLQYAMDIFYNVYPVWSDEDGGWHEGAAYWNGYMNRITWWMDIIQSAFRIDGFKKPFFSQAGDFPLYVFPPGAEFGGFGDSSDTLTQANLGPLMDYLADRTGNPYWKWYAGQVYQPEVNLEPTYLDLLRRRTAGAAPQAPTDIPQSKVFHGVGIASLHADLADSKNDVHVLFKSSPFGSRSHGFNAQNSFLLWAYGKPLLNWSGHRDWHGSPHHKEWMWETFSDNSITVNGIGQKKHSPQAKGKIIDEYLDPRFDYIAGDATEAYEGRLNRFVRHICFIKPRLIVIMDELQAPEPSTFEYHLHSNNPFDMKSQYEIDAENDTAAVRIAFVTPSDLNLSQEEGHNPPSIGFDKKQWHLQAQTPVKSTNMNFLTMLRPYPAKKILSARFDFARRGNLEMYHLAVDLHKVLVFINPRRESYSYGSISSDAAFMLMATYKESEDDSMLFASEAGFIKMADQTLFESAGRDHYFIQWKDLKKEDGGQP
ncbi:MAG: DUF4962 domain-containing protein [Candidatus Hinthialibacter sp.]